MKGIPKEKSSELFSNSDNYQIIGYREEDYECGKDTKYYILDDRFIIRSIAKSNLSLSNEDSVDFVKLYETDYVKVFIDKRFENVFHKSLSRNESLDFNFEIWDRTWMAYSLNRMGIELSEELNYSLTDEEHKINYLQGVLDFATDYMNFDKFCDAHYDISFSKINKNKARLIFEMESLTTINKKGSEEIIIRKIEEFLFKGNQIENFDGKISYITSRKIFLLIDCLFFENDYSIHEFYDGYKSSKIVFEYNSFYYLLNFDESD